LYAIVPLLIALALVLRARGVELQGSARLVLIAGAVAVGLYVTKIGGDPRTTATSRSRSACSSARAAVWSSTRSNASRRG